MKVIKYIYLGNKVIKSVLLVATFLILSNCSSKAVVISNDEDNNSSSETNPDDTIIGINKDVFNIVRDNQIDFIKSLQQDNGALRDDINGSKITPYFANFAIMALLSFPSDENVAIVKKYIEWYLNHLNDDLNPKTGKWEVRGSIYDYNINGLTNGTYDSIDSYAATFLHLLRQLAELSSENLEWVKQYSDKIKLVAEALEACIDTDKNDIPAVFSKDNNNYLSIASYTHPAKYLMDNSEVVFGLKAAKWLVEKGILSSPINFETILTRTTSSFETFLWKNGMYNWVEDNSGNANSNWSRFYPDAAGQLYPALFGVISPNSLRATILYDEFNAHYQGWETGKNLSTYPWTIISLAAAKMNDNERVIKYINHIYEFVSTSRQKPYWYSMESGCLLLAMSQLSNN